MRHRRRSLTDKVVLITGGARGIGAAVGAELARRGAVPVLADVDVSALAQAAATIAPGTLTVALDVSDYVACEAAVAAVLERHGRLDIVWANAGIGVGGPVELADADAWTRVIEVNLIGAYNIVRAGLAAVIAARGYVAVTASLASFAPAWPVGLRGVQSGAGGVRRFVAHRGRAPGGRGGLPASHVDRDGHGARR